MTFQEFIDKNDIVDDGNIYLIDLQRCYEAGYEQGMDDGYNSTYNERFGKNSG